MRFLGIIMFLAGNAGLAFSVRATLQRGRPGDVAFALLSWVAVLIAILGLALIFVPKFLE